MKQWRISLVLILIILFGATIITKLFFLQVLNRSFYRALAQGQQRITEEINGKRGEVFFQGRTQNLAINKNWKLVYISPKEINKKVKDPSEVAKRLSEILNLNEELILEKIKKDNFYAPIKNKLTNEELDNLNKLNLTGVYLEDTVLRYYPQESLASQVIGFVGGDGQGQYGLEGYYNELLKGEQGFVQGEKGPQGYLMLPESAGKPLIQEGSDLILTLDYNIQFVAEKLLTEAQKGLGFEEGQILVMEPDSGKIIALANFPGFNPNQYSAVEDLRVFQNGAFQKIFEPGSVFKPITMAAALDQEKITPDTTYVDEGKVKIGGYTIYNYGQRVWGEKSMTEVLENSINTGAVFAERQLGHELFLEYINRFGLFGPTGIDLQGEISSDNKEFKKGYEINFATASFGQGIEMTPIQLARAFCAIANGGRLMKPYIVEKIIENDKVIEVQPEIQRNSVISSRTASQLSAMMVSVVENGPYTKRARIPGYYIAGKTGTAQVPEKGTYSPDKTWQSFVGFAPAFSPRFLILVKLDNPKTKTAEYSAVPIFRELAKYIIDYWQIAPDYEL